MTEALEALEPVAHSSERLRLIAEPNTVLRGQVGSGLHGVTVGNDDRDEMGVCIEPPHLAIPCTGSGKTLFELYQFRTQPAGVRSGAGDLDLTIYSLRKWAKLAAAGNPSKMLLAFIPEEELTIQTEIGRDIQAKPERFISRYAAFRFAGYLRAQREKMLGQRGGFTPNRPELIEQFGFDTKFAYHMVRLGIQGIELLTEGRITLPIPQPERQWLQDLRDGKCTMQEAVDRSEELEATLLDLGETADWPEEADFEDLERWLTATYFRYWDETGQLDEYLKKVA